MARKSAITAALGFAAGLALYGAGTSRAPERADEDSADRAPAATSCSTWTRAKAFSIRDHDPAEKVVSGVKYPRRKFLFRGLRSRIEADGPRMIRAMLRESSLAMDSWVSRQLRLGLLGTGEVDAKNLAAYLKVNDLSARFDAIKKCIGTLPAGSRFLGAERGALELLDAAFRRRAADRKLFEVTYLDYQRPDVNCDYTGFPEFKRAAEFPYGRGEMIFSSMDYKYVLERYATESISILTDTARPRSLDLNYWNYVRNKRFLPFYGGREIPDDANEWLTMGYVAADEALAFMDLKTSTMYLAAEVQAKPVVLGVRWVSYDDWLGMLSTLMKGANVAEGALSEKRLLEIVKGLGKRVGAALVGCSEKACPATVAWLRKNVAFDPAAGSVLTPLLRADWYPNRGAGGAATIVDHSGATPLETERGKIQIRRVAYGTGTGPAPSPKLLGQLAAACASSGPRCSFTFDVAVHGDPAPGHPKAFAVEYACAGRAGREFAWYRYPIAQGDAISLSCESSAFNPVRPDVPAARKNRIRVHVATYGNNHKGVSAGNATWPVLSYCENRERCDYKMDVKYLGDPLPGTEKALHVEYSCTAKPNERIKLDAPAAKYGSALTLVCAN